MFLRFMKIVCILTLFQVPLLISGCSEEDDGPKMVTVKGTVSLDGKPIRLGNMIFEPADGAGRASAGEIKEGEFEFRSPLGLKKVIISAYHKSGKQGKEFGEDIMESYIPAKYNTKSELTETVQENAANVFQFELESK